MSDEWFEIGDGWIGVSSTHERFLARFAEVFVGCRAPYREDGRPVVFISVEPTGDGRGEALFDLRHGDGAIDVARLVADQAFPEAPSDGPDRYRPAGWTRTLECAPDRIGFDLDDPWPWLVSHLAVFAVLREQPHLMCFHGAAMEIHGRGVMLLGASGAGKTTLAVSLARRGHGYLSDEIAAVETSSRLLVPVRRSALVRNGSTNRRTSIGDLAGRGSGRGTPLRYVLCLRRFSERSTLERFHPSMRDLSHITPLACSLTQGGASIMQVLTLIGGSECYFLDSADPQSATLLIEELIGSS